MAATESGFAAQGFLASYWERIVVNASWQLALRWRDPRRN